MRYVFEYRKPIVSGGDDNEGDSRMAVHYYTVQTDIVARSRQFALNQAKSMLLRDSIQWNGRIYRAEAETLYTPVDIASLEWGA